jgi:hypothetical protein
MYDPSVESLLQKYCDEAQTREALHRRAFYNYKKLTTCFQLPIIILSALSGSMAFLSKGYPEIEEYIVTGTASVSICVSIISAVASYLKLGETKSKHETSQVAWQAFHNTIKHEIALRRDLRQDPNEFIQEVKATYQRLFEISPICNAKLIKHIKKKIESHATDEFQVPTYLNGFRHSEVYRERGDEGDD